MGKYDDIDTINESDIDQMKDRFLVSEIFGPTIQGEGSMAGAKCIFVRFAGCDYRCSMCDSMHAVDPQTVHKTANKMTAQDIVDAVHKLAYTSGTDWIIFSGGNPAIQDLTKPLQELKDLGYKVAVETQGSIFRSWLRLADHITISPKGPGMGAECDLLMLHEFVKSLYPNPISQEDPDVCIKVVLFNQMDIEFALNAKYVIDLALPKEFTRGKWYFSLGNDAPPLLIKRRDPLDNLQVEFDDQPPENHLQSLINSYKILAEDVLKDSRISDWRFLPQLHVFIWSNESKR